MPFIQPIIKAEIDPTKPVLEICAVIMAILPYHPGQDEAILKGVKDAIDQRLSILKGDELVGE